ncbi:phosphoinositide-3-kinase-interacting protein 1 [Eucyclogobius newberryi]|uniref:phosphoinositide-3-kinase-interacting protein 1 n=1 Tax=Eucyclogobius newberryi TaxID=166745 RepID=UPI003B5A4BAB
MFSSLHLVCLTMFLVDNVFSLETKECVKQNGEGYRGTQSTSLGLTCMNWINMTRDYDVKDHPDSQTGVGDHNYCRNPDLAERPWCYIAGPDGITQRGFCKIEACQDSTALAPGVGSPRSTKTTPSTNKTGNSPGEPAEASSVLGVSQRVRKGPQKKKDLGTTGYVLGILMMTIIIILGAGITVGYFYKRARDLKRQHEQRAHEREMQRISLPLSAFSNPTCELVDENTIVITAEQEATPIQDIVDGGDPLMGPAGTPGA